MTAIVAIGVYRACNGWDARRGPADESSVDPSRVTTWGAAPGLVTDHGITIDARPDRVWPWLVQMGWHRAGWYTSERVDRLLSPANRPSADRIVPELQHLDVGEFAPDGPLECG